VCAPILPSPHQLYAARAERTVRQVRGYVCTRSSRACTRHVGTQRRRLVRRVWVNTTTVAAQAMPDQCVLLSLVRIWVIASTSPAPLVALLEGLLERIRSTRQLFVRCARKMRSLSKCSVRIILRYAFPDQYELYTFSTCCAYARQEMINQRKLILEYVCKLIQILYGLFIFLYFFI